MSSHRILNTIRFDEGSAIISYETDVPFLSILQVQPREGSDKSAYRIVDPRTETTIPSIEKGDGFDMAGVLVSQGLSFDLFYETTHIGSFVDTPREPPIMNPGIRPNWSERPLADPSIPGFVPNFIKEALEAAAREYPESFASNRREGE